MIARIAAISACHSCCHKTIIQTETPDEDRCWNAVQSRDALPDTPFFYGVRPTGIYCRPDCSAHRPSRPQVQFFAGPDDTEHAGFRVCLRWRLPFLASLADEPNGLHWLDLAVNRAAANNLYVILDLHGAPGSQSDQGHTGQADLNRFFKDPANVTQAEKIWTQIARRYQGNPAVAGYDTLNEPTGTPNSDTLYVVQDRLYRAIRAADPTHVIFIENGYTTI